jgi:hypothetical protein
LRISNSQKGLQYLYGAKNMNMISTGAFQTEMDASNKLPSVAEKFAAIWEKKNAKAVRAGGISLMALSLAACGSDTATTTTTATTTATTDTTTTDTATTDTTTTTTTTAVTPVSLTLTTAADIKTQSDFTTGDDTVTGTGATYETGDVLVDGSSTDNDTLTVSITADMTATPAVQGIENIVFNVTSFAVEPISADNISSGTITVNNLQPGGATEGNVINIGSSVTVGAGSQVTTLTTDLSDTSAGTTIDGNAATTVTVADAGNTSVTVVSDRTGTTASATVIEVTGNGDSTTGVADDAATISAMGEVNLETQADGTNTDQVENLTLSGNGAAVTYNLNGTADAPETVTMTGSQSVTLVSTAVQIAGEAITDSTTAGTTTLEIGTSTGAVHDLSPALVDVIEFTTNTNGGYTFTVVNTQAVVVSGDMTANGNNTLQSDLTSGDETLNLTVEASQSTADTILTDFEVVNLTVSNDKATSVTITIEDLTAASSTVNIDGPDNLTLSGTHEIGTINAASLAGVLTMTVTAASNAITGGTGADVFTMADIDLVLDGGGGNDTLTMDATIDSSNNTVSFASIEVIQLDSSDNGTEAFTVLGSDVTGQSISVKSGGTTAVDTFEIETDGTTTDLSGLTVNTTTAKILIDLAGTAALANSITGTNGADTTSGAGTGAITIDSGAGDDTLILGSGADGVTAGEGIDIVDTGAGADTVVFTETTAAHDTLWIKAATDINNTVTGFGAADVIRFNVDDVAASGTADLFDAGDAVAVTFANTDPTNTAGAIVALDASDYVEIAKTGTIVDNKVNIITDSTGYATVTLALDGVAATGTMSANSTSIVLGFYNSTDSQFQIHYVSDVGTSGNDFTDVTAVELVAFTDIISTDIGGSFSNANFEVFSLG